MNGMWYVRFLAITYDMAIGSDKATAYSVAAEYLHKGVDCEVVWLYPGEIRG